MSGDVDTLRAGDVLGTFQLLCPVARGGMGQVWAARRTGRLGLPKVVAVKTALPLAELNQERLEKLFFDEARVAASIDHPNVCRILDLGEDQGVLYLAMEWIDGASLAALFTRLGRPRRLPFTLAARIVAQACAGLHAAHELRDDDGVPLDVVHRDATPQNILISVRGDVKVVDFGVVKSRDQVHQATVAGEVKGKISYLSPEQLLARNVDRRTDIFALGNVLYLATTGQRPFAADTTATTLMRIMEGKYALPGSLLPDYPAELERIVTRALAHDPADRFSTAEEMRLALEEYLAGEPPVGAADLAELLMRHLGPEIEARREEIRAAQRLFDSQGAGVVSTAAADGTAEIAVRDAPDPERAARAAADTTPSPAPQAGTLTPLSGTCTSAPMHRSALPRSRRALLGGVGLVAALVLAAAVWLERPRTAVALGNAQFERTPARAELPARAGERGDAAAPAISGAVSLSVRGVPEGASVIIDDRPPISAPVTLIVKRDDEPHVLRVRAPRHAERVETVFFDRDQTISVELRPSRLGPAPRARVPVAVPQMGAPPPTAQAASGTAPDDELESATRRPRPRRAIDEGDPFQ